MPAEQTGNPAPEYRLPASTRLGRVVLQIGDLARSLPFYENVLGLRVLEKSNGSALLGAAQREEPLVELMERTGARPLGRRERLGLFHFAICLPERSNLAKFVRHLRDLDIQAGMSDHLVSEAVYLHDPDGLGVEVYADRPRSRWNYDTDGQIVMATDPLDTDDLLASSGDGEWAGMPDGSRLGHIHLHVGDLDLAARFYHEGLGFDRTVWSYPGALFMSAGGYHHHLGTNTWARSARPAAEDDARLLEWTLVVPGETDAAAAGESLERADYSVRTEDSDRVTADPWGTTLRITT